MKTMMLVVCFSLSSTAFAFRSQPKDSVNSFQTPEVNLMIKHDQKTYPELIAEITPIMSSRSLAKNRKQKRA